MIINLQSPPYSCLHIHKVPNFLAVNPLPLHLITSHYNPIIKINSHVRGRDLLQTPDRCPPETRAQTRAAETLERFKSLRMTSKLVLPLRTRAVKERCKARGAMPPETFVPPILPPRPPYTFRCARCLLRKPMNRNGSCPPP